MAETAGKILTTVSGLELDKRTETDIALASRMSEIARLKRALQDEKKRRMRAEATLNRLSIHQKMIYKISSLALSGIDPEPFLAASLEALGRTLDLSRAYLFEQPSKPEGSRENMPEWAAEGMPLQPPFPGCAPWWRDMMANRLIVRYRDIEEIPGTPDKEILRARGVKSVLALPLFVGGRYRGFLGLEECRKQREWFDEDVETARIASLTIASFFERRRLEEALEEREERYRFFTRTFRGITFARDMNFAPRFLHGAVKAVTGYSEEDFVSGKLTWKLIIHEDDLPRISESAAKLAAIPGYTSETAYRIVRKDGAVRWVYETAQNVGDETGAPVLVRGTLYDVTAAKKLQLERDHLLAEIAQTSDRSKLFL